MRWVVALALLGACGEPPEDPRALRRDALVLQAILGEDRSPVLLIDVENAVSARKPVYAAELIAGAVLPQVDAQLGRARSVELTTVTARKLQLRIVSAYKRRREGLSLYQSILATGMVETPEVIDALHAQREAEDELLLLDRELSTLRPVAGDRPRE